VRKSIESLRRSDSVLAQQVFDDDRAIDRQRSTSRSAACACSRCSSRWPATCASSPPRSRSRTILERVGDHAVNIAGGTVRLAGKPLLKPLVDIPRMADLAIGMLNGALDAFVRRDPESARRLVVRDDEVDDLNRQVFRELLSYMMEDPTTISRALELVLVRAQLGAGRRPSRPTSRKRWCSSPRPASSSTTSTRARPARGAATSLLRDHAPRLLDRAVAALVLEPALDGSSVGPRGDTRLALRGAALQLLPHPAPTRARGCGSGSATRSRCA
jgi:phosphate transport system protein